MSSVCMGSFFGAHKYQPRYHTTPPDNIARFKGCGESFENYIKVLTKKTYVCDVCVKCGDVIRHEVNYDH